MSGKCGEPSLGGILLTFFPSRVSNQQTSLTPVLLSHSDLPV